MHLKSNYFISAFQSCLSIQANSHLVNSPHFCQQSYQLTKPIFKFVNPVSNPPLLDILPKAKIRDYPSGLEPDLKPRKAFIYLSYYTLTYQPLTSILPSRCVLRGLNSCQNGILVLFLPTLELGKISTLVNGNISNIGSRLWENIDFLYTAVKEKGTLTKEHPQPLTLI